MVEIQHFLPLWKFFIFYFINNFSTFYGMERKHRGGGISSRYPVFLRSYCLEAVTPPFPGRGMRQGLAALPRCVFAEPVCGPGNRGFSNPEPTTTGLPGLSGPRWAVQGPGLRTDRASRAFALPALDGLDSGLPNI